MVRCVRVLLKSASKTDSNEDVLLEFFWVNLCGAELTYPEP